MRFRKWLFAFGLAALALRTAPVFADPVPVDSKTLVTAPDWIVGSNWYYSDGYALKVTSVAPAATVFDRIDAPGQWFSRQGFLRKDLTSGTATRTSIFRTVPDDAGKVLQAGSPLTFQREYLENGSLVVHASSWTVEGRETITVPAGTFDCWIIVWRSRSLRSDWTGFERWWYSPQAQNYVRMEYKYGPDAEGSRVLMRYQLGAQAAQNAPPPQAASPAAAPVKSALVEPPAPATDAAENPELAVATDTAASNAATSSPVVDGRAASRHSAARLPAEPSVAPTTHADAMDTAPAGNGNVWHAQVASSKDEAAVRIRLEKTLRSHAEILSNVVTGITAAEVGKRGVFYRAWVGQFDRSADAIALCGKLRAGGAACSVSKSPRDDSRRVKLSKL